MLGSKSLVVLFEVELVEGIAYVFIHNVIRGSHRILNCAIQLSSLVLGHPSTDQ